MKCPSCGSQNAEANNFCTNCGTLLVPYCPRCQFGLEKEANFCGNCGLGLTPRAAFLWPHGWETPVPARREPPAPGRTYPGEEPSLEPPATIERAPATPTTPSLLEQYVPKELMSKLDAARARGEMVGERRIVTMLFCDVKGSTAAAEQLDPEEWTEIINGVFEYMIKPVYKYEGTVARLMGDGILAFFGAPIAHEDDPQRGVLAGLDIVNGMKPYREKIRGQWDIDLDVRVGINTGLVVVGAVGSDLRMEYSAMGDAINLAARMEQTAEPGTVQIAHDTYRLVGPLFEVEELGGIQVKGKEEPVPAYRVLRRKKIRGSLRGIEGLEAEMVGRSQEMANLQSVFSDLERGVGRIVCLMGGAGLGKSRLIQELKNSNGRAGAVTWVETASLSYESVYPYGLFQQLIRRLNGISAAEEVSEFWDKIHALISQFPEDQEARFQRVLATLFGLPDPAGQPPLEGEGFKRELYAAMRDIWQNRFTGQPTILVLDDLHWADAASVELLLNLLPIVESSPVVMLCAFRPDRAAPAYQLKQMADERYHHRYTEINLRPLSDEQSNELVNRLLAIAELPDNLRARILERASGNPFFVEEVVRTLIEKGAVVAEDRSENGTTHRYWRASSEGAAIDIPNSLQGLLASRIDRLEEETRSVIQLAAVIGRTFYHRVLTEIARQGTLPGEAVEEQIGKLVRMEMIREAARVPEVEYKFRNPLTQEIAYQTILLKRRREFHNRVGDALELLFPDRLNEFAPRLAFHFSEGQNAEKALAYYRMAGDNAFRLFALEDALANYGRALEWVDRGGGDNKQLVHLYRRRGRTYELLLRHDEALETYRALEALGDTRGDDALRLAGIAAQGTAYYIGTSDWESARQRSEEALVLAQHLGDKAVEARSLWNLLLALTWIDPLKALEYGEKGLNLARELASLPEAPDEDLELLALILLDMTMPQISVGSVESALEGATEAQKIFEEMGNLPMISTAGQRIGLAYQAKGMLAEALANYERSQAIDESIGNEGGLIGSIISLLDLLPQLGDFTRLFDALEALRPLVAREGRFPEELATLYAVAAYYHLGAMDRIRELVDPLLAFADTGIQIWPNLCLSYAAVALIQAGDLAVGGDLLEKSEAGAPMENYLLRAAPNVIHGKAELARATGDLERALNLVETFLEKAREKGVIGFLPSKLYLMGEILLETGQEEMAYTALREAHTLAAGQQARTQLWKICARLADLEEKRGDTASAQSLREEARTAIDFIAERAGGDEMRASFLSIAGVQKVLASAQ